MIDSRASVVKMQRIVGVVQVVGSPVGSQGVFDIRLHQVQEGHDFIYRQVSQFAGEAIPVETPAIVAADSPKRIHHLAALRIIESALQEGLELAQDIHGLPEEGMNLRMEGDSPDRTLAEQVPAKSQGSSQVSQRHDRQPFAHQGVVGVVPFRALGVHPDAAFGDEVGQLGEQQGQQFLRQVGMHHAPIRTSDQPGIRPEPADMFFDGTLPLPIELDGVIRIFQQLLVGFEPVRYIRIAEYRLYQVLLQLAGVDAGH